MASFKVESIYFLWLYWSNRSQRLVERHWNDFWVVDLLWHSKSYLCLICLGRVQYIGEKWPKRPMWRRRTRCLGHNLRSYSMKSSTRWVSKMSRRFLNMKQGGITLVKYDRKFEKFSKYALKLVDIKEEKRHDVLKMSWMNVSMMWWRLNIYPLMLLYFNKLRNSRKVM